MNVSALQILVIFINDLDAKCSFKWKPLLAEIAGLDQITGNVGEP